MEVPIPTDDRPDASDYTPQDSDHLADFSRDRRVILLSFLALLIGAFSAGVAYVLVWLIGAITNLAFYFRFSSEFIAPAADHLGLLMIAVPVVGGLIIGFMARYGSERIRGHGIPEALEAILVGRSRMDLKVAILKPLSSALSIGTGGPFGAEGPIIMTGGAFGSLFGQFFHLSSAERRILLVAGAAGGMSAIFASPIAAVLLSIELLLFEWKPRSFVPVALASIVASMVRIPLLGSGPIFPVAPHGAATPGVMIAALAVGLLAGVGSALLTQMVYAFEDLFHRLPIHWMWWPAIGGLVIGIGGLIDPRVLGVGYATIRDLLGGGQAGTAMMAFFFLKAVVWAFALGSGTSGGVLAPLLLLGGALGSIVSPLIPTGDTSLWVMVGMAAMMGGTMRSPLTAMAFALELTHDLNALPAVFVSSVGAHALTVLVMRRSILTEKVARRGVHLTREYIVNPLEIIRVGEVMDPDVVLVPADTTISALVSGFSRPDSPLSRHHGYLIVDTDRKLRGIITRGDILRMDGAGDPTVLEAATPDPVVTYPDETLRTAVDKMAMHDIGRLPVVSREEPGRVVGYLGRPAIVAAWQRRTEEEHLRERGWKVGTPEAK